jgi:hypothetical protein
LVPESARWTKERAIEELASDDARVQRSAAVRLLELAEDTTPLMPGPLDDGALRTMRVFALDETHWVIGVADAKDERSVWTPVEIAADGGVRTLAETADQPARLWVSDDPQYVPHMLVTPEQITIRVAGSESWEPALELVTVSRVRFALDTGGVAPRALVVMRSEPSAVAGAYMWDLQEFMFVGPMIDALPDPHVGEFEISLAGSPYLVPQGGVMPEPLDESEEGAPDRQMNVEEMRPV